MSDDGFLSRWSRRKRAAQAAGRPPRAAPVEGEADAAVQAARTGEGIAGEPVGAVAEPEASAEALADLPSLEELTADSDVSLFLRRGVPESLRNAALRRMWSLDPKIRDFVSEAREYAYDWNTPGGVPGSGPLLSSEVRRLAARVMGGDIADDDEPAPLRDEAGSATDVDSQSGEAARHEAPPAETGGDERAAASPDNASESTPILAGSQGNDDHDAAVSEVEASPQPSNAAATPSPRRRHGGALPG
jgi:hypothetical protein